VAAYSEVIDSNQTWSGNTVISFDEDVLVVNCTLTIADGNVTVYGNLTLQTVCVITETAGDVCCFHVADQGHLIVHDSSMATIRNMQCGSATVAIYDSTIGNVESHDNSTVALVRCTTGSVQARDDSRVLTLLSMMTNVDAYCGYSSPHVTLYNSTIVHSLNATNCHLEIAHTVMATLDTWGTVTLTFDNMTVTGNWTTRGPLHWCSARGRDDLMPDYRLDWGETYAAGYFAIDLDDPLHVWALEVTHLPLVAVPTGLRSTGTFINITLRGPKMAAQETLNRIYYTDAQIAGMVVSTLRLYGYRHDSGWQQLPITGVNTTGKYVWGNLTSTGEDTFSMWFAALGEPLPAAMAPGRGRPRTLR
jgi:hypothetical protein